MSVDSLNRHHLRVLEAIVDHRSHNVEWRDVLRLMQALGDVVERHDGKFDFHVGQASMVFARPHNKDLDVEELTELRRFLVQAGVSTKGTPHPDLQKLTKPGNATVVLIDFHRAQIYQPNPDTGHLQEQGQIKATDTEDMKRHLAEGQVIGERAPETIEYFERVIDRLKSARAIVLIGDATGKSAIRDFVEHIKEKHPEIADRIVATEDADLSSIQLPDIERLSAEALTNAPGT